MPLQPRGRIRLEVSNVVGCDAAIVVRLSRDPGLRVEAASSIEIMLVFSLGPANA